MRGPSSRRHPAALAYWRTAGGRELDFIVVLEDRIVPIEVKRGARVRREERRHLRSLLEEHGRLAPYAVVLHGGQTVELLEPKILGVSLGAVP